ncbi:MAG: hypothetical protein A2Y93_04255 [Chloroflexi bacterium RBG_13_68_17]|nr:MAG: hypothetical protein A2Y93_04255 [Chloroflexi bacterium RBG_13_68_17]
MEAETVSNTQTAEDSRTAKALGAYYTENRVASFLVEWAIRSSTDRVLDPGFGQGVFLRAAWSKIKDMGGRAGAQVYGVEVDSRTYDAVVATLPQDLRDAVPNLILCDFFELTPAALPPISAVVGNPPFIRYQKFNGDARTRALDRARSNGVPLNRLSSSWAPFVAHSTAFLEKGGRLAMVVPLEIAHAGYARPVLDHLLDQFSHVELVTFRQKLFPTLGENTALLLADGKEGRCSHLVLKDLEGAASLPESLSGDGPRHSQSDTSPVITRLARGGRLPEQLLPPRARAHYDSLRASSQTRRMGDIADVGIGYVTGHNKFFHLSPSEAALWGIPSEYLRPAVRRGRALRGLRFTHEDWSELSHEGMVGFLLHIGAADANLPAPVLRYLESGEAMQVPSAYKCRTRTPWYAVPHVHMSDALLTYMSNASPRLAANLAGVVATNTLHLVRLKDEARISGEGLAALSRTSLVRLSAEIEGHALGGGLLKLEPSEADALLLPWPDGAVSSDLSALSIELDDLVRSGKDELARQVADREILIRGLGWSQSECALLNDACVHLQERRRPRRRVAA